MGAVTENYVAQQLAAKGYDLYYWESNSTAELDFILQKGNQVIGVEVKRGSMSVPAVSAFLWTAINQLIRSACHSRILGGKIGLRLFRYMQRFVYDVLPPLMLCIEAEFRITLKGALTHTTGLGGYFW